MKLNISNTIDEVLGNVAEYFIAAANDSIAQHGSFEVALSGGSSPKKLYSLLTTSPYTERVDWDKVLFFFGDERYVPTTDPASNYLMAQKVLFEPLNIDMTKVFAVDTTLAPEAAAAQYMNDITRHFDDREPIFDLVLLGLGDNSHTASLFPYTPVLQEQKAGIKSVFLTDQQVYRITFTAPLINMAARVAFLVYGETKSDAVYNVLEGENDAENFPAQLVNSKAKSIEWFMDRAAAARLMSAGAN
ncbi:MAG: 6-phosphogluconolactonase [Ferruginibacter sp.]